MEQVGHVCFSVDAEEVEPVRNVSWTAHATPVQDFNLPIIDVETHGHNGRMPPTGALTPCVVLCTLLLLILRHHLHLLCPRLLIIVIEASCSHWCLHLLTGWHLVLRWWYVSIALWLHGDVRRLAQGRIDEAMIGNRESDLGIRGKELIWLEVLPDLLANIGRVASDQEQIRWCARVRVRRIKGCCRPRARA